MDSWNKSEVVANENVRKYTNMSNVDDLQIGIYWRRNIHTDEPKYGDPTYWHYDKGVEEQIKDDRQYKS